LRNFPFLKPNNNSNRYNWRNLYLLPPLSVPLLVVEVERVKEIEVILSPVTLPRKTQPPLIPVAEVVRCLLITQEDLEEVILIITSITLFFIPIPWVRKKLIFYLLFKLFNDFFPLDFLFFLDCILSYNNDTEDYSR
jgi:hypothetical protein